MTEKKSLGNQAEEKAAEYLISKGYKIRDKNWYAGHHELDIVAEYNQMIIFVEVKCRSGNYYEQPYEAVNRKKQKFIISAANYYIHKYNIDFEARFDIISMIEKNGAFEIEHIEDAFYPLV
jgi:putative endonuclease